MERPDTGKRRNVSICLDVDATPIDVAVEKANQLVALLREAADLINSLSRGLSEL